MIGDEGACLKQGHASGIRINRPHDKPWNAQSSARLMTLQAGVAAFEARVRGRFLVERVKDDALLRVESGKLKYLAGTHESDCDTIVEIESPWSARRNPRRLETGFRKDQNLR